MSFLKKDQSKDKKSDFTGIFGKKTSIGTKSNFFSKGKYGGSLMDKIKNMSKRDMALVAVGLSVLVSAPVAEFLVSTPNDNSLKTSSFGASRGAGDNALASLYEPGINSLSQGSADGAGEIITPLSSRDPSSLILGAEDQAEDKVSMTASLQPSGEQPSEYKDSNPRDAVGEAARDALSGATRASASLVKTSLPHRFNNAPRGLGISGSGIGSSDRLGSISSKSSNVKAASSSSLSTVKSGNTQVTGAVSTTRKIGGSLESLKTQAASVAGKFSQSNAVKSVDEASTFNPESVKGLASGGSGAGGKGNKLEGVKYAALQNHSKNGGFECSTLECEAQKRRQQNALEWEKFLKYDIPKTIINAVVNSVAGVLGDATKNLLSGVFGGNKLYCVKDGAAFTIETKDKLDCLKAGGKVVDCNDPNSSTNDVYQIACKGKKTNSGGTTTAGGGNSSGGSSGGNNGGGNSGNSGNGNSGANAGTGGTGNTASDLSPEAASAATKAAALLKDSYVPALASISASVDNINLEASNSKQDFNAADAKATQTEQTSLDSMKSAYNTQLRADISKAISNSFAAMSGNGGMAAISKNITLPLASSSADFAKFVKTAQCNLDKLGEGKWTAAAGEEALAVQVSTVSKTKIADMKQELYARQKDVEEHWESMQTYKTFAGNALSYYKSVLGQLQENLNPVMQAQAGDLSIQQYMPFVISEENGVVAAYKWIGLTLDSEALKNKGKTGYDEAKIFNELNTKSTVAEAKSWSKYSLQKLTEYTTPNSLINEISSTNAAPIVRALVWAYYPDGLINSDAAAIAATLGNKISDFNGSEGSDYVKINETRFKDFVVSKLSEIESFRQLKPEVLQGIITAECSQTAAAHEPTFEDKVHADSDKYLKENLNFDQQKETIANIDSVTLDGDTYAVNNKQYGGSIDKANQKGAELEAIKETDPATYAEQSEKLSEYRTLTAKIQQERGDIIWINHLINTNKLPQAEIAEYKAVLEQDTKALDLDIGKATDLARALGISAF